jgi:diketogulonate reductase-like aldo/keto reductase
MKLSCQNHKSDNTIQRLQAINCCYGCKSIDIYAVHNAGNPVIEVEQGVMNIRLFQEKLTGSLLASLSISRLLDQAGSGVLIGCKLRLISYKT